MADSISDLVLSWYRINKRRLSFRDTGDAYLVLVSEFMLQQTRAETAEAYFNRFTARFPDLRSLADSPLEDVLKEWEGLGYYSRARSLHRAAAIIRDEHGGRVPDTVDALLSLPGVGPYSAAAVASIAFGVRVPAMDGNLYRIFARLYDEQGCVDQETVKRRLYSLALADMPENRCGDFNQAMMDLGSAVCVPGTPDCAVCPLSGVCRAFIAGHPESLPVRGKKRPPAQKDYAVVILTHQGRTCLFKRSEKMLNSLYVFLLIPLPEGTGAGEALDRTDSHLLSRIPAKPAFFLGSAKHVFTHQVWNMSLILAECAAESWTGPEEHLWTDRDGLAALPMPGAMKAAREKAVQFLSVSEEGGEINSRSLSANLTAENTTGSTVGWDSK
ncbi:MAG: A/G-specific adenine glycosylase [Clostridia bacterium]|nr:A/G-specific adenine glycosylase [Clostridia bacterium]